MRSRNFSVGFVAAALALWLGTAQHSASQMVTNVYSFSSANSAGNPAYVVPLQGRDANLHGTTLGPVAGGGSVFTVNTLGYAEQIYPFGTSIGVNPGGGLTLGTDGNYYGTTTAGGAFGNGVLYKINPDGTYTDLHDFEGGSDGAEPIAPPIQASNGKFYGTTVGTNGASTVYEYSSASYSSVYSFDPDHGQYAVGALLEGSDGNLYGTAEEGGADSCGTIFELTTSGTMLWTYSFPCGAGGNLPSSPLIQGSDGNYYGTTVSGGSNLNWGTVFKLDQSGNVSILHDFVYTDGASPFGGLTQGTDNNLYGTTQSGGKGNGTLFQISSSGSFKTLAYFGLQEQNPYAGMLQHTNGLFYGTTYYGGRYGYGNVYSLNMGLGAFVAFVLPAGARGQSAQLLGQGFIGTSAVTFNGVPAKSFKVASDTYMTAVVPSGATTGKVVVTTPTGPLTSNVNFRILN